MEKTMTNLPVPVTTDDTLDVASVLRGRLGLPTGLLGLTLIICATSVFAGPSPGDSLLVAIAIPIAFLATAAVGVLAGVLASRSESKLKFRAVAWIAARSAAWIGVIAIPSVGTGEYVATLSRSSLPSLLPTTSVAVENAPLFFACSFVVVFTSLGGSYYIVALSDGVSKDRLLGFVTNAVVLCVVLASFFPAPGRWDVVGLVRDYLAARPPGGAGGAGWFLSQFPEGTILATHEAANPAEGAGWAVCGRAEGTPDLKGRFLMGSGPEDAGTRTGTNRHSHELTGILTTENVAGRQSAEKRGADDNQGDDTWLHKHRLAGGTGGADHVPPSLKVVFLCRVGFDSSP